VHRTKVSDYKILDSDEINRKGLMLRSSDDRLIAYKLSRQQRAKIPLKDWRSYHETLIKAFETHDDNPRGRRKAGFFARYILFGWRKIGNGTKIGQYVSKGDPEAVQHVHDGLIDLMAHLEEIGLNCIPAIDLSINNKLKEGAGLEDVMLTGNKGRFSAIAIAQGYWSPVHIDDDIFYTLLSCVCHCGKKGKDRDDILFYFLFPAVGYAIPMRSTDVLVFNSDFPHCSSNFRKADSISFSLFTNATTATAHMKAVNDELEQLNDDLNNELEDYFDAMSLSDDGEGDCASER
jgi:hypothetical protein